MSEETYMSFYDSLPSSVRTALVALAVALLGWAGTVVPGLDLPVLLSSLLGAIITFLVAWLSPVTKSFGVKSWSLRRK